MNAILNIPADVYANVREKALAEGRSKFALEVCDIIGTLSVHKPPMQVIGELIALCGKEAV